MAECGICKKRVGRRDSSQRLAIPEYRAMVGIWPWHTVRVCGGCREAHERDFLERLRLLAPQVLENDEPIVAPVCLVCGAMESAGGWREASKWVDADGRPARRAAFRLCVRHADAVYVDGVVVSSNLTEGGRFGALLDELPVAGGDLVARVEGWRPGEGRGPAGATDFREGLSRDAAVARAIEFWRARPEGMEAQAAWMGPVRKDYGLRYRLDLARDFACAASCGDGRRESLILVRTGPDALAVYRTEPLAHARG